jgi:nucleotidyltransferase substrate binding protein (TIGR01987 family)
MTGDIRWKQRSENLKKAILFLKKAVEQETYNKLEAAGLAQSFEFTFELSWKTLKDYLSESGFIIRSPREAIKQAFQSGIIQNGHLWMQMLEERNRLTHTYNEEQAQAAIKIIRETYFPALLQVFTTLEEIK